MTAGPEREDWGVRLLSTEFTFVDDRASGYWAFRSMALQWSDQLLLFLVSTLELKVFFAKLKLLEITKTIN